MPTTNKIGDVCNEATRELLVDLRCLSAGRDSSGPAAAAAWLCSCLSSTRAVALRPDAVLLSCAILVPAPRLDVDPEVAPAPQQPLTPHVADAVGVRHTHFCGWVKQAEEELAAAQSAVFHPVRGSHAFWT